MTTPAAPRFADKTTLKRALTHLHEQILDAPFALLLFGGAVLIREISARARLAAQEAANAESADNPDQVLYWAMLIQQSVVDPQSGQPYADGRTGPDGQPLIDPRTRTPLFTVDETLEIASGREVAVRELINRITDLSALGQSAMFSGGAPPDGGERDARTGTPQPGDTVDEPAGDGPGNVDERDTLADQPVEGVGAAVPADAG